MQDATFTPVIALPRQSAGRELLGMLGSFVYFVGWVIVAALVIWHFTFPYTLMGFGLGFMSLVVGLGGDGARVIEGLMRAGLSLGIGVGSFAVVWYFRPGAAAAARAQLAQMEAARLS